MAKCEEGYLCSVCGGDVEHIWESDLYLRYVIGQVDPETLHTTRERHIRCNPTLAQFIVDPDFAAVTVEGPFDKCQLDPAYVKEQERLLTRAFRRQTGLSFLQWLNQERADKAAVLLRTTGLSVEQVAARSGFSSSHHLIRAFKKRFRQTPRAYRLQAQVQGREEGP